MPIPIDERINVRQPPNPAVGLTRTAGGVPTTQSPGSVQQPNIGPGNPGGPGTPQQPTTPVQFGSPPSAGPGGAQVSQINPQADLRGQQISPGQSAAQQTAQGQAQRAAQQVSSGGFSPYSTYQQVAQPYQQAGQSLFNQAAGAAGQQQQFTQQANQAVQGTGFGTYGPIQPTLGGAGVGAQSVRAQQIGGPTFSQGPLQLPGISTGPAGQLQNLAFGQDTQGARSRVGAGINNLYDAPDRQKLATDQFNLLQEQAAPQIAQQQRDLGKSTAAFGRSGSGLVNTQLADIGTAAAQSRDQQARQLSLEAAGQTLNDRLGVQGAAQSGLGQLSGLDSQLNQSGNENILNQFGAGLQYDAAKNNNALDQAGFNLNRDATVNDARFRAEATNAGNRLQADSTNAGNQLQAGRANADIANQYFGQQAQNRDFAFGADQARNNLAFNRADLSRGLGSDTLEGGRFSSGLADQAFGRGDTERANLRGYEQDRNSYNLDRFNATAGYEGQQYGQDLGARNEQRGERDYQGGLEQQATDRAIQQTMAEEQFYGNDFNRNQDQIGTLGNLGYRSDPTGQMNSQAQGLNQSGDAAIAGAGDYLGQYAASQAGRPRPGSYTQGAVDGGILNTTPRVVGGR